MSPDEFYDEMRDDLPEFNPLDPDLDLPELTHAAQGDCDHSHCVDCGAPMDDEFSILRPREFLEACQEEARPLFHLGLPSIQIDQEDLNTRVSFNCYPYEQRPPYSQFIHVEALWPAETVVAARNFDEIGDYEGEQLSAYVEVNYHLSRPSKDTNIGQLEELMKPKLSKLNELAGYDHQLKFEVVTDYRSPPQIGAVSIFDFIEIDLTDFDAASFVVALSEALDAIADKPQAGVN